MVSAIASGGKDPFMLVGGVLVGSAWFAFGTYGGLPLIDTVPKWHPPITTNAVEESHLQGLLVMRRRKLMTWFSLPCGLAAAALLMPLLMQTSHPEFIVLLVGIPLGLINMRYYLSRCPRCGLGFFTKSSSRAALIREGHACGHCGLSLKEYKR